MDNNTWILSDSADRATFERQGGFVNTSALTGLNPRWQPRLVIDVASMPSVNAAHNVTEIVRGLQGTADGHAALSHEILNPTVGVPDWFHDAAPRNPFEADPIPRGSLLNTRPVAYEPLREYCKAALSRCDEDALSSAVSQWVRWGVEGYAASRRRKRHRTEEGHGEPPLGDNDSKNVEGESKGDDVPKKSGAEHTHAEDAAVAGVAEHSENDGDSGDDVATDSQLPSVDVMSNILVALVMNRRDMLLHDRFGNVAKVIDEEAFGTTSREEAESNLETPNLSMSDALKLVRGTTKVLRDAVHRQRRVVRRFGSSGLEGLVAHHAKEANSATSAGNHAYPSVPLLDSVREQHGRVIAALDALADAQCRFMDAHREARVALEDAAEAVRLIEVEQQGMDTLLKATALECNAVDEVRQILVQELRSLKTSLPSR